MGKTGRAIIRRGFRHGILAGCAATALTLTAPVFAQSDTTSAIYAFNIPAQDLVGALNSVAIAANAEILFGPDLVRGISARSLAGRMTAGEALDTLLEGSGLTWAQTDEQVFTVQAVLEQQSQAGEVQPVQRPAQPAFPDVEEIQVKGVRGSIISALERKRESVNVVDSIDAEDLGRFPDNNIAESLQRVPGVAIERSISGQNRSVTVRGLGSQFTLTEINGMTGAPGGGGRAARIDASFTNGDSARTFNFGLLPTEILSSAIVTKSPVASDTEGGIAAVAKFTTPDPLDLGDRAVVVSAQGNWSSENGIDPRLSGFASYKANENLGVLFGAIYTQLDTSAAFAGFLSPRPLGSIVANPEVLTEEQSAALGTRQIRYEERLRTAETVTVLGTLSFQPSENASFRLDAIYSDQEGEEFGQRNNYELAASGGGTITSATVENGYISSATYQDISRFEYEGRADNVDDQFLHVTLAGDIELGDGWKVSPFLGYSRRELARPYFEANFAADGTGANLQYTRTDNLDQVTTAIDYIGTPDLLSLAGTFRADNESDGDEVAAELNTSKSFETSIITEVRAGARYSESSFFATEPFRGLGGGSAPGLTTFSGFIPSINYSAGFGNLPNTLIGGRAVDLATEALGGQDVFAASFDISQSLFAGGFIFGSTDELATASVKEETLAGYVEADAQLGNLRANFGVRIVTTDTSSSGSQVNIDGELEPASSGGSSTEVLPALNLRYDLTDQIVLRGTYSRALSRPDIQDLAARETLNFTTLQGSRGNPDLDPFLIDQFDIGAEWYFHPEGLIGATFFRKDFDSIIGNETVFIERPQGTISDPTPVNRTVEFVQPVNSGAADITGFEVTIQSGFFFLPEPWRNFGAIFNYTNLDSSVEVSDATGNITIPFPNLSPSSLNAGLYYDDGTFDARINYAWREGFLFNSIDPTFALFQEDIGQVDWTMNYRFNDNVTLQFQATNLFDRTLNFQQATVGQRIERFDYDRRIIFGVRASL